MGGKINKTKIEVVEELSRNIKELSYTINLMIELLSKIHTDGRGNKKD